MRIVIIGPAHPFRGGIALGNELMAADFQKQGHDTEIITFTKQYPSFLFPGKSQFSESEAPKSIRITRSIHAYNPLNWFKVGRQLRIKNPDLIIIRYWLPLMGPAFGTILRCVKKNKHTKIIGLFDNVIPHEKRIGDKPFTRYFIKPLDGFVTMAKSVEHDLLSFDTAKPRALHPHPIFPNYGQLIEQKEARKILNIPKDAFTILFFGLIRPYKGLDILLEAIHKSAYTSSIHLVIAGECYTDEETYSNVLATYNLTQNVTFHNHFIKDEDVRTYFSAANILALPYRSATQSGVTQIAYHFNLPMIVSNVGALPDMVPHEKLGLLIEPNATACATAIDRFISEELEQKFRPNFDSVKEKFSWNSLNQEILSLYKKL